MLGSLDPAKVLVVLVIALIVLGPERLPRVARQAGAAWREFVRIRQEVTDEVRSALPDPSELPSIPRIPSVRGTISRYIADDAPRVERPLPSVNGEGDTVAVASPPEVHETAVSSLTDFVPAPDDPSMN